MTDEIKIKSITPDTSKPLNVGDKVEMEVDVEYSSSRSPAQVGLNIQNGDTSNETLGDSISEIKDNIGKKLDLDKVVALDLP